MSWKLRLMYVTTPVFFASGSPSRRVVLRPRLRLLNTMNVHYPKCSGFRYSRHLNLPFAYRTGQNSLPKSHFLFCVLTHRLSSPLARVPTPATMLYVPFSRDLPPQGTNKQFPPWSSRCARAWIKVCWMIDSQRASLAPRSLPVLRG